MRPAFVIVDGDAGLLGSFDRHNTPRKARRTPILCRVTAMIPAPSAHIGSVPVSVRLRFALYWGKAGRAIDKRRMTESPASVDTREPGVVLPIRIAIR